MIQDATMRIDREPDRSSMRHPRYQKLKATRTLTKAKKSSMVGVSEKRQWLLAMKRNRENPFA
jgi:hypothetical protein